MDRTFSVADYQSTIAWFERELNNDADNTVSIDASGRLPEIILAALRLAASAPCPHSHREPRPSMAMNSPDPSAKDARDAIAAFLKSIEKESYARNGLIYFRVCEDHLDGLKAVLRQEAPK